MAARQIFPYIIPSSFRLKGGSPWLLLWSTSWSASEDHCLGIQSIDDYDAKQEVSGHHCSVLGAEIGVLVKNDLVLEGGRSRESLLRSWTTTK